MKYPLAVHYVASNLWAMLPSKITEMVSVLAYRAAGHEFTADEIKARIGDAANGSAVSQTLQAASGQSGTSKRGAVAVIPIRGVIAHRMSTMDNSSGGTSCEGIAAMLRAAVADDGVGTIVFDCDSVGGTVTGMSELAAEVYAARDSKHIVAVANGLIASAAYDIASQAHEIVCIPSGMVGSIGVFCVHEDLSAALEKEGIKVSLISAGKFKTAGNPFEALSDDERAVMQARVDEAYGQFVKDVARGRGVTPAAVRNGYGEGRALTAKDALAAGLIDRIATMDETIGRLVGRKSPVGLRASIEDAGVIPMAVLNAGLDDENRAARLRLL